VLDCDALSKVFAAVGGGLERAKLDEHAFVGVDGDRASMAV
jgi:hypothetical protein